MKPSAPLKLLLMLQCSLQLFTTTRADFLFSLNIFSHSTSGECDVIDTACETFFPRFCLRPPRGSRSTDDSDCPLGRNTNDLRSSSGIRDIFSNLPWPGGFQLFFEALDDDGVFSGADHLDYIFIDRALAVGTTTLLEQVTGGRVTVQVSFSVDCLDDFYGDDCSVFCQAQSSYTCNEDDGSRVCLPDYYGADCVTFCQDSNDPTNGFFTCDEEDGSIICNDGFREPQTLCRENIDDCAESPCENGGTCGVSFLLREAKSPSSCLKTCAFTSGVQTKTCTRPEKGSLKSDLVDDFMCTCPAGYTGEVCSIDINECLEAICAGNSTCVEDVLASFRCQCNPGFEGENCTEIQPCESVTCDNGGTCVSGDPFSHECLCSPGFNGTYCENDIDECLLVECENGGTCVADEPSTFECFCPENYGGLHCELDVDECLLEEVCPMGLTCVNDEPGFRCLVQNPVGDESRMMVIAIGAVAGGVVIIIALILIVIVIILLTRRRAKSYRADRSHSHIYHPSPLLPDPVKCVSLSPTSGQVQQSDNPLYGTQTTNAPEKTGSPDIHTFDNSLYEAASNPDTVIYDQVRTDVHKLTTSDSSDCDVAVSHNIAYESLSSPHSTEATSNPMYATSGGNAESSQPPTYSVPGPAITANGRLREIDGYTVLRDADSNPSVPPPYPDLDANGGLREVDGYMVLKDARDDVTPIYTVPQPSPKRSQAGYESIELRSKAPNPELTAIPQESSFGPDSTELTYAEPATIRSASRKDAQYNTLQHTESPPPVQPAVRLAAMPDSGYTKLETES